MVAGQGGATRAPSFRDMKFDFLLKEGEERGGLKEGLDRFKNLSTACYLFCDTEDRGPALTP